MNRYRWVAAVAAVVFAVLLAVPSEAGQLYRLSSEYSADTNEIYTNTATPVTFYTKTVTVPTIGTGGAAHFIFVTLIGQGDVHNNNATQLACKLDGTTDCKSTATRTVQKLSTDEHDNSLVATWCVPAEPGAHTVTLQMNSDASDPTEYAYMEVVTVHIDAARLSQGACVEGTSFVYELNPPI